MTVVRCVVVVAKRSSRKRPWWCAWTLSDRRRSIHPGLERRMTDRRSCRRWETADLAVDRPSLFHIQIRRLSEHSSKRLVLFFETKTSETGLHRSKMWNGTAKSKPKVENSYTGDRNQKISVPRLAHSVISLNALHTTA